MSALVHGVGTFFDHLAAVQWRFLGLAVVLHVLKTVLLTRAWRNIVAASYPRDAVRWRGIFGAYAAGAGVNAILPARSGDLVKLYVAKHQVPGSTYTTLASTLVVLTIFDFVVASALFLWALQAGVLPSLDVLPRLPRFDVSWLFEHPRLAIVLAVLLLAAGIALAVWATRRIAAFKRRVAQGFTILRDRRAYLRRVALWQAADWAVRLFALYWFLRAFGIEATAHNALLVQVTQSLSTIFPFSPGGIGTEQALMLYVLAEEASRTALLAFSVGTKLTIIVVNVLLGLAAIGLLLRTLRWRRVLSEAREKAGRPKLAASGERSS